MLSAPKPRVHPHPIPLFVHISFVTQKYNFRYLCSSLPQISVWHHHLTAWHRHHRSGIWGKIKVRARVTCVYYGQMARHNLCEGNFTREHLSRSGALFNGRLRAVPSATGGRISGVPGVSWQYPNYWCLFAIRLISLATTERQPLDTRVLGCAKATVVELSSSTRMSNISLHFIKSVFVCALGRICSLLGKRTAPGGPLLRLL